MCPRVWPGVWIAVKPGTDIGPSAVSASSTGTGSGGGMIAATTRMKPLGRLGFRAAVNPLCIDRVGDHPRPGPAPQLGHATDVVGMPVGQQNRVHLTDRSPCGLDRTRQLVGPPGNPGVDQHDPVVNDNGVSLHVSDRDFNHAVDDFAHVVIVACGRREMNGRLP